MFVPDESEPLSDRCARPADLRHAVGTRDVFPIGEPAGGAGHPHHRDAPRLVVEWDGRTWQPVAIADSWAAAHQMIVGDGRPPVFPQVSGRLPVFRPEPRGRHND
ncbi:DUF6087 family protein [Kitasatospora sp. DSM 101779]|uniref:DUF6087 family protein n=1 Tax=Kitasatospora sp. DSM 101779 TaxID=2853165 RepID=UPI0021DA177A|nr:DUF6087 family protein [Kitasatospora sp. DSM 101779]MCU7826184.1 hypothetical protein [Kitasatospora sp. DSM 101779]